MEELDAIRELFDRLMEAALHKFPSIGPPSVAPTKKDVYVIYDQGGRVEYVGRTPRVKNGIRQRLKGHLQGRSLGCR